MAVMSEERVVLEKSSEEDDDVIHLMCHCTEGMTAACGKDVSNDKVVTGFEASLVCAMCHHTWPFGSPKCPWGCSCEGREWSCGPEGFYDE